MKTRSRIVLIIAKVIGIVLLAVAVTIGQEAFQEKAVKEKDVFTIKGRIRFAEKTGEELWRPKKQVLVQVEDYPAFFFIDTKSDRVSEAYFNKMIAATDTVSIAVHKEQLALLYTPSTIRLYGLFLKNGKSLYTYNDAFQRDKKVRLWLYVQVGICLLGGLILLFLPKKYLLKE